MSTTTNPDDPKIGQIRPDGQQESYLVLSDEERAKGFVRPVRKTYKHVGLARPGHPTRELTDEEKARYADFGYVAFEEYPPSESAVTGRFWTQAQLDKVGKGCGTETRMGQALAETYARDPRFYGGTFCVACQKHFPVGPDGEFVWVDDGTRVGI